MAGLSGKVAIVTGAGRGIGRGTALELAKAGARVVLAGIGEESIGRVKGEIDAMGGEAFTVKTDISRWEDAQRLAKKTQERYGRIDILVNNAGIHPQNERNLRFGTLEIGEKDWDLVIDTNLKGPFNVTSAVLPYMIGRKFGRIVNVSLGHRPHRADRLVTLLRLQGGYHGPHEGLGGGIRRAQHNGQLCRPGAHHDRHERPRAS